MNKNIKMIVLAAMLSAFVCLATFIAIPVPMTHGYAHLGDVAVLLCGFVLGPLYGALAAGIGSAFADLFMGFAVYIPATFVIKGAVALAAALVMKCIRNRFKYAQLPCALSALCAEIIMPVGYFLYEVILYGVPGALGSVVGNITQAIVGIIGAVILAPVMMRIVGKYLK